MIEKDRVVLVGDKSGALDPDKRNARTSKYTNLRSEERRVGKEC